MYEFWSNSRAWISRIGLHGAVRDLLYAIAVLCVLSSFVLTRLVMAQVADVSLYASCAGAFLGQQSVSRRDTAGTGRDVCLPGHMSYAIDAERAVSSVQSCFRGGSAESDDPGSVKVMESVSTGEDVQNDGSIHMLSGQAG